MPEMPFDRLVENLVIADGGLQEGVPIHQPLAAVDEAFAEQVEERLPHGAGTLLVERETRPLPVAGAAHLPELIQDSRLVLRLPLPDALDQLLTPQVVPRFTFFFSQPLLDHR